MIWVHFIVTALVIGLRDITTHRIKRHEVNIAMLTLIPTMSWGSFHFAFINLVIYSLARLGSKGHLGRGDVRLSPLIGIYASTYCRDLNDVIMINVITWSVAAIVAVTLLLARRISASDPIAFAPFMFAGLALHAGFY